MYTSLSKFVSAIAAITALYSVCPAYPTLTPGTWVDIGPKGGGVSFGNPGNLTQGMAVDPSNPSTLYVCICSVYGNPAYPRGIYKSTDRGSTWTNMHNFDSPNHIRVDPRDPQHLYLTDGVAGGTHGFYVSKDGGTTWTKPQGFLTTTFDPTVSSDDIYQVAADPADFNHLLISYHSAWPDRAGYTYVCGVLESSDGGDSWAIRYPAAGMGGPGFGIFFLYNPALGIGDKNTWLLGNQGGGYWRTSNAGTSWRKVSDVSMDHGGGQQYYTKSGVLYASGYPNMIRSTDNGLTWESIGPNNGYLSMIGDGTNLYSGGHGGGNFVTAKEESPQSWTNFNAQTFREGPFEMAIDTVNRILYSANITGGVWALKLPATATENLAPSKARASNHSRAGALSQITVAPNKLSIVGVRGRWDINGRIMK